MAYPIIDVSSWELLGDEAPAYIGERDKAWIKHPENGRWVMFKIPREDRGEHWAEKICYELACKLNLPNAEIELAVRDGKLGCLSYFFVDKENGYSHYDSGHFLPYSYNDKGKIIYKIEDIEKFLNGINLVEDFLSIIMFDALVANGDRHQDNWGITRHETNGSRSISSMYDNSACLCRDLEPDDVEKFYNSEAELLRYIYKGKAKVGMSVVKNANHFTLIKYLLDKYPQKMQELIHKIKGLTDRDIEYIVNQLPETLLTDKHKTVVINFIKLRRNIIINIGENMNNDINKLLLIWKDPDTRKRFVVGTLNYFIEEDAYEFAYLNPDLDEALKHGFQNYPSFPDIKGTYKSVGGLFPGIRQRLPNQKRPNYPEILMKYNLDGTSTDMEKLAATRGRLGTDTFEFVQAIEFKTGTSFQVTFDLAAARRYDFPEIKNNLSENDIVSLIHHLENEVDEFAIKVMFDMNLCLGFVPKYYSREIFKMINSGQDYVAKIKKLDINNSNPDEWVKIFVEVILQD
ncbi:MULTISPECIES: hypothetical protein [unclassified Bacillus (in: firmicutes)]|uniref:hypothetical protein n=1 Tax=unclassified Bacillus (in: firmicutes) TaxID=185979 RepID=UPI000BF004A2|nr:MULTISPECIES: hypothetical protein [unclassified Bacillus (in: firmicutes)]PEJ50766.1 hypothetical protein CN692_22840 [Bacillus sp. AFS002410]PEL07352.1 hypothetical protein CN601_19905 [Bacillus sp. AFS017336]